MKNKANISLLNLSEVKNGGIFLALRKGFNEVFRTVRRKKAPAAAKKPLKVYKDMISVIICTANRPKDAAEAARTVAEQAFGGSYEVILVNNSDIPYTTPLPEGVRVLDEPVPGLSRARNRGAEAAHGDILLYIDDDARASNGLLSTMYSAFKNHPRAAIIGGQIFLHLPEPTPEVFSEGRESIWSGYTVPYSSFREVREQYEFPYGACFAIRHGALDTLGGFPESYGRCGNNFAGGEEIALCFAAAKAKLRIGIEPHASVVHMVSRERFTKEHIRRTIYEGITTTQRLFLDGYSRNGWSPAYIKERIRIIESEIKRLKEHGGEPEVFYKQCELDAFKEIISHNKIY